MTEVKYRPDCEHNKTIPSLILQRHRNVLELCSVTAWPLQTYRWHSARLQYLPTHIKDRYLEYLLWKCPKVNATRLHLWVVNTGSENGLVLSGNKPLFTWTNVDPDLCHNVATISWIKLFPERYGRNFKRVILRHILMTNILSISSQDRQKDMTIPLSQGPLLLTWINFNPRMDKVITSIIKYEMKLLIHSQTSTAAKLVSEWISNCIPHFIAYVIT